MRIGCLARSLVRAFRLCTLLALSMKLSLWEWMEMWADHAGLVCKLSTRTTILAAMNPRAAGHELASPLLSRFDMVSHPSVHTPHAHQKPVRRFQVATLKYVHTCEDMAS